VQGLVYLRYVGISSVPGERLGPFTRYLYVHTDPFAARIRVLSIIKMREEGFSRRQCGKMSTKEAMFRDGLAGPKSSAPGCRDNGP